jgi:hypothetical protein
MATSARPGDVQATREYARALETRLLVSANGVREVKGKGPMETFLLALNSQEQLSVISILDDASRLLEGETRKGGGGGKEGPYGETPLPSLRTYGELLRGGSYGRRKFAEGHLGGLLDDIVARRKLKKTVSVRKDSMTAFEEAAEAKRIVLKGRRGTFVRLFDLIRGWGSKVAPVPEAKGGLESADVVEESLMASFDGSSLRFITRILPQRTSSRPGEINDFDGEVDAAISNGGVFFIQALSLRFASAPRISALFDEFNAWRSHLRILALYALFILSVAGDIGLEIISAGGGGEPCFFWL